MRISAAATVPTRIHAFVKHAREDSGAIWNTMKAPILLAIVALASAPLFGEEGLKELITSIPVTT